MPQLRRNNYYEQLELDLETKHGTRLAVEVRQRGLIG